MSENKVSLDEQGQKSENLIKKTCKELGLTQKELAEQMGIAENTISQWSRGIVPTPAWAIKMFGLLKIERQYNTIRDFFINTTK